MIVRVRVRVRARARARARARVRVRVRARPRLLQALLPAAKFDELKGFLKEAPQ